MIQLAGGADTVFLTRLAGFQRAQATQFALDRYANGVCHLDNLAGNRNVVLIAGRGLAVFTERAIHHHAGKPAAHRLLTDRR